MLAHYVNHKPSATKNIDDIDLKEELARAFVINIVLHLFVVLEIFSLKYTYNIYVILDHPSKPI